jgi:hypothetical protein
LRGKAPVSPVSWAEAGAVKTGAAQTGATNVSAAASASDFVDILQYQPIAPPRTENYHPCRGLAIAPSSAATVWSERRYKP